MELLRQRKKCIERNSCNVKNGKGGPESGQGLLMVFFLFGIQTEAEISYITMLKDQIEH